MTCWAEVSSVRQDLTASGMGLTILIVCEVREREQPISTAAKIMMNSQKRTSLIQFSLGLFRAFIQAFLLASFSQESLERLADGRKLLFERIEERVLLSSDEGESVPIFSHHRIIVPNFFFGILCCVSHRGFTMLLLLPNHSVS